MTPDEYLAYLRSVMETNRDAMLRRWFPGMPSFDRSPTAQVTRENLDLVKKYLIDVAAGNDPITDAVLRPRLKEVRDMAKLYGFRCADEELIIGTLPTFQPNACTFIVPEDGRRIVAFTEGLPGLLNRLAKVSLQVFSAVDPAEHEQMNGLEDIRDFYQGSVARALARRPELAVRFGAIIAAFAFEIPEILPPQPVQRMSLKESLTTHIGVLNNARVALLMGAERFVAGHEFGHLIQDDNGAALPSEMTEVHGASVNSVRRDHATEYAADIYGEALAFSFSKDAYHPEEFTEALASLMRRFDMAGPWFFLSAAEALDSAHQLVFGKREAIDDTHPPYPSRRDLLHSGWVKGHGYRNPEAEMLEIIISSLWSVVGASQQSLEEALQTAWNDSTQEIPWRFTAEEW